MTFYPGITPEDFRNRPTVADKRPGCVQVGLLLENAPVIVSKVAISSAVTKEELNRRTTNDWYRLEGIPNRSVYYRLRVIDGSINQRHDRGQTRNGWKEEQLEDPTTEALHNLRGLVRDGRVGYPPPTLPS